MTTGTIDHRAYTWRTRNFPDSCTPDRIMNKATEELGEVARALVGEMEGREGRGDLVQEAAQTVIVLASLVWATHPEADLLKAVYAELKKLGA